MDAVITSKPRSRIYCRTAIIFHINFLLHYLYKQKITVTKILLDPSTQLFFFALSIIAGLPFRNLAR